MQVTGERGSVVISATLKQNAPGVEISSRCRRESLRNEHWERRKKGKVVKYVDGQ